MTQATLEERIEKLEADLNSFSLQLMKMTKRLDYLEAQPYSTKPKQEAAVPAGVLLRGKYKGKRHDEVVNLDPGYVTWNFREGYAEGLGFTSQQVAAAQRLEAMQKGA